MGANTETKSRGIASWPEEERPRERLLSRGPQAMTDAELLAIVLRVGYQGTNAVELGRLLLRRFGSLRAMAEAPLAALMDVKGLKGAKAAQVAAAMEIARRVSLPDRREKVKVKGTGEAADYLRERLRGLSDEHFRVLFLNRVNRLLDEAPGLEEEAEEAAHPAADDHRHQRHQRLQTRCGRTAGVPSGVGTDFRPRRRTQGAARHLLQGTSAQRS
jgi:DNA repair protein RadC